jgi:hypothetical protein
VGLSLVSGEEISDLTNNQQPTNNEEVMIMNKEAIQTLCRALAIVTVAVGGYGSLLCVPYALCNNLYVIATAGIYFVAGAVMIVGGLLTYSVSLKNV